MRLPVKSAPGIQGARSVGLRVEKPRRDRRTVVGGTAEAAARAIFLFLVVGSVAFDKTFAHLHITVRRTDLWITELGLAAILSLLTVRLLVGGPFRYRPRLPDYLAAALLGYGLITLLRHTAPIVPMLHDFALVYYCVFFFIVRILFDSGRHLLSLALAFGAGVFVLVALTAFAVVENRGITLTTGAERFLTGQVGLQAAAAVCFLVAFAREFSRRILLAASILAVLAVVLVVQSRSVWLALLVAMLVMVGLDQGSHAIPRRQLAIGAIALVLAGLAVQLVAPSSRFGEYLAHSEKRLAAGLMNPLGDPTSSFRLTAWTEAIHRIQASPIFGQGFGRPFGWHWNNLDIVNRPHNTYLWLAVNTGLLGLLIFIGFVGSVASAAYRDLRGARTAWVYRFVLGATGAFVAYLVFGSLNLLLESPYLAIGFWSLAALATIAPVPEYHRVRADPATPVVSNT
jgi:O-antigen ligase